MGKNRGPLLETRTEQAIEKLYEAKRREGWSPTEVFCLLRSRPAVLANLHEESVIEGFDHFKGTFEDLSAMVIQVLFLRERTAAAYESFTAMIIEQALTSMATGTKKRRQRKPSPKVEDPAMPSKGRSKSRTYR